MKKSLWIAACALALGSSVVSPVMMAAPVAYQADSQATPPPPDQVVAMMSSKLSLTDDQKAKITPIIADRQQRFAALQADTSMRKFKKARQAKSIMDDSNQQIEALLTDTQKKQFDEMKEQMKEQMKQRMQQQGGSQ